jgi:hypothetical protein
MSSTYTVVGMNPGMATEGYDGSFVDVVVAMSPAHAAYRCRRTRANDNECDPEDFEVLAVFVGSHTDEYDPLLAKDNDRMAELDKELES